MSSRQLTEGVFEVPQVDRAKEEGPRHLPPMLPGKLPAVIMNHEGLLAAT